MRRPITWLLAGACGMVAAPAQAGSRPDSVLAVLRSWRGRVTYLAGSSVYVNAGRLDGLALGDTIALWRSGRRVANVAVDAVASHRSTCDTLAVSEPIEVGDEARFAGAVASTTPSASESPGSEATSRLTPQAMNTRADPSTPRPWTARVGARYLAVTSKSGASFSQPMLDLRFEERSDPVGVSLDLRGRRSVLTTGDGERVVRAFTRVHRATASFGERLGPSATLGRQSPPSLGVVSVFDGLLLEQRGARYSTGVFAGTQPEPDRMRFDGRIREVGAFLSTHGADRAAGRWTATLGAVASYDRSTPDREFGYLQGSIREGRVTAFATQEIDLQRAWKRALGEPAVSMSSSYLSVHWQLRPELSLTSGYDNRRRVRLWRDRDTPETEFDDRYRQGTWLGTVWSPWRPLRLGGELRALRGGDPADSWTLTADWTGRMRWAPTIRTRASSFDAGTTESSVWSAGLGAAPWSGALLGWSAGNRRTREVGTGLESSTRWSEISMDAAIARRCFGTISFEADRGDAGWSRQWLAGLSWRL